MIRKTRLVKVIFGCCAAIFLILQFLETRTTASEATTTAGSGDLKLTKHEAAAVVTALPASKSESVKPLPVVVRVVPVAASLPPNPPIAAAALLAGSKNSSSKEVPSASGAPAAEPSETKTEPKSSLSGERIHGLPNETQITPKAVVVSDLKIARILDKIKLVNEEQSIRNEDIFGPVTNATVIVAIQCHNRLQYLRQLVISLSQAAGIDKTLIVFSHDYWDDAINDLVNSVDFAKTMQIFYPFSIQTHPNEFPGESSHDCPRNAKKDQAQRLKCLNADWPDLYGHYREAKFTQTKHHWWWKANRIFDQLRVTKSHDGLVLFLEEDHYVSDDFLSVLRLIEAERTSRYPNCDIICLGTYLKSYNYNRDHKTVSKSNAIGVPGFVAKPGGGGRPVPSRHISQLQQQRRLLWLPGALLSSVIDAFRKEYQMWPGGPVFAKKQRVEVMPWESAKHNMGMVFNRKLWEKIHACREYFCNYDDYNWDWSLQHLSKHCFKTKLEVMLVKGPRVFHIGECGVHHKKKLCEATKVVKKVQDILVKAKSFLFPTELKVTKVAPKKSKNQKNPKGNGGWGDHRDRALCLNMASTAGSRGNRTTLSEEVIKDLNVKEQKTRQIQTVHASKTNDIRLR